MHAALPFLALAASAGVLAQPVYDDIDLLQEGPAGSFYGRGVAIDGDLAIVGAPNGGFGDMRGRAYVMRFDPLDNAWRHEDTLIPSESADFDFFGQDVAIDGGVVAIGADEAVYLYRYEGANWEREKKLERLGDPSTSGGFGDSISLSGDLLAVGEWATTVNENARAGIVNLYRYTGDDWVFETSVAEPAPGADALFGWDVALDGGVLVAGAPGFSTDAVAPGRAHFFRHDNGAWDHEGSVNGAMVGDRVGVSVDIEGTAAVIGATTNSSEIFVPPVRVYRFGGDDFGWQSEGELPVPPEIAPGDFYGGAVAIDGATVCVGAQLFDDPGPAGFSEGRAFIYFYDSRAGQWAFADTIDNAETNNMNGADGDRLGSSVALSGPWALLGQHGDDTGGTFVGAARVLHRRFVASPDLNFDGLVDSSDLAALIALWGAAP